MSENTTPVTPAEYFEQVKGKKQIMTEAGLSQVYDNCMRLLEKYRVTGQVTGMKKILFCLETLEKEQTVIRAGITQFVYKDDIEYYMAKVADKVVKIIDLENYEREIPDDVTEALAKVKDQFDKFYVVFTDYTGTAERQVKARRRNHDPILFGTFQNPKLQVLIDRFYFIGDWVDEYCDLTLDKMVSAMKSSTGKEIVHEIVIPEDIKQLKESLNKMKPDENGTFRLSDNPKAGLFAKIRTFLTRR